MLRQEYEKAIAESLLLIEGLQTQVSRAHQNNKYLEEALHDMEVCLFPAVLTLKFADELIFFLSHLSLKWNSRRKTSTKPPNCRSFGRSVQTSPSKRRYPAFPSQAFEPSLALAARTFTSEASPVRLQDSQRHIDHTERTIKDLEASVHSAEAEVSNTRAELVQARKERLEALKELDELRQLRTTLQVPGKDLDLR